MPIYNPPNTKNLVAKAGDKMLGTLTITNKLKTRFITAIPDTTNVNDDGNIPVELASLAVLESNTVPFDAMYIFIRPDLMYTASVPDTAKINAQIARVKLILDSGRGVFIQLQFGNNLQNANLAAIKTGGFNNVVIPFLAGVSAEVEKARATFDPLVLIAFLHEAGAEFYPWSKYYNLDSAGALITPALGSNTWTDFPLAFTTVSDLVRANLPSAKIILHCVKFENSYNDHLRSLLANIDYTKFDWFGVTYYNKGGLASQNFSFPVNEFDRMYQQMIGLDPSKDIFFAEFGSVPEGQIFSWNITSGGSSLPANVGITVTTPVDGVASTLTPVLTAGVLTGINFVAPNFRGRKYVVNPTTANGGITFPNIGAGVAPVITSTIAEGTPESRAIVYTELFELLAKYPKIIGINFFAKNKESVSSTTGNYNPSTAAEFSAIKAGHNRYIVNSDTTFKSSPVVNRSVLPASFDRAAFWTSAGTNAGAITRPTAPKRFNASSYPFIALAHNGTAGLAGTNEMFLTCPPDFYAARQDYTFSFLAYTDNVNGMYFKSGLRQGGSPNIYENVEYFVGTTPTLFTVNIASGAFVVSNAWHLVLQIGQNSVAGNVFIAPLKMEAGQYSTPVLPAITNGLLYSQNTSGVVTNTAAEASLIALGTTSSDLAYGSNTLLANFFKARGGIAYDSRGIYNTAATAPTLTVRIKVGTLTVFTGTRTITLPASQSGEIFELTGELICRTAGNGAGSVFVFAGRLLLGQSTQIPLILNLTQNSNVQANQGTPAFGASTIDTTVDNIIDVTCQFNTASALNEVRVRSLTLRAINQSL